MNRTRRSSIVSSIASRTGGLDYQELPQLLDDSYLLNRLEKLALVAGGGSKTYESNHASQDALELDPYNQYNLYLQDVNVKVEEYDTILQQVSMVQQHLEGAIGIFETISSSSSDFIGKTRSAYSDYGQLSKLHRTIPKIMDYFRALDPIMRRLNHASSPNLVKKNSFNSMLTAIDQSLFFLEDHQDLAEAELYSIRFKRCLIRACELISNYLGGILRQTCNDINQKLKSEASSSPVSREALVYNKFEQLSQEYYTRFVDVLSRVHSIKHRRYHDELGAILTDCFENYFQTRTRLLAPIIRGYLEETDDEKEQGNLVQFIQNSKAYFEKLCTAEFELFNSFHGKEHTREIVLRWLCQLCDPLYDSVRTKILRETDISMLCDSVTLFGQYYQFEDGSEEYRAQFSDVQFDKIFEPIVQKLQARLILRVQIYIQQHIVGYVPSKDSSIISRRKKRALQETDIGESDDPIVQSYVSNITQNCSDGDKASLRDKLLNAYYPPLITSLALLSKIYELLNAAVFDDLAHHIVHDCIVSLRKAYAVNSSSEGFSNIDVKLSYLSNLLLLRQEIQNFNIQYTVSETYLDFSGVEAFFKGGNLNSRERDSSVLDMAKGLVPKVVNSMVDARSELISELRIVIRELTEAASAQLVGRTLKIDNCDSQKILENNNILRSDLEDKLPRIYSQITTFIDDKDVVESLMDAIQEVTGQKYSDFYERVSNEAERGVLNKSEISELMYDDVFTGFVNNIVSKLTRKPVRSEDRL